MLTSYNNSKQQKHKTNARRQYIDIVDNKVEYCVGNNIEYYKGYQAQKRAEGVVSFPLDRCDPLPLNRAGDIKFFFTSAIEGQQPLPGQPFRVTDPDINSMVVVRGKAANEHTGQVYIGFNSEDYKSIPGKKIFAGKVLVVQHKDTRHVENRGCYLESGVEYLHNQAIGLEIKKHLDKAEDWNWKSPVFLQKLQELFCQQPGVHLNVNGMLLQGECYWTKEENKLKGFKYK